MKKIWKFSFVFALGVLLCGCADKFEPTESTIYVTSKGQVKTVLMEEFEADYYDFDELSQTVADEVKEYNLSVGAEAVEVESLTKGTQDVTLSMNYESVEDYAAFNDVILFHGTYEEAVRAGYEPTELYDTDGMVYADVSSDNFAHLNVLVTEENVCVQTSGRIKFVSDHVNVLDKKLGKVVEAGKSNPAFILYK